MAEANIKPKFIHSAKKWSDHIENLYRFQKAGYRDEIEYKQVKQVDTVECWPETGFVKKLQRRDNTFYYYDKERECEDKEVHKVKVESCNAFSDHLEQLNEWMMAHLPASKHVSAAQARCT